MMTAIETQGLSKRYGDLVAVDGLDLHVEQGEVFGLLGPNGSGKTTTILMLLGLTEPTSGRVRVLGHDPVREPLSVKRRVGYLPDTVGFYDDLSGRENLRYTAALNGMRGPGVDARIDEALDSMGLTDAADRPVRTYSRGMKQRLGLADVLLKEPQLVILDEPTLGLDPQAAHEFLGLIRALGDRGLTVLLSSHLLHQVQTVTDRVGLFRKGRMALVGSVPELARQVLGGAYRIHLEAEGEDLEAALGGLSGVLRVRRDGARYLLEAERDLRDDAARAVVRRGGRLLRLDLEEPDLDEVYRAYFEEVSHGDAA
ncbi:ABC transporter related protein [Oceanithermus profundus DSM 14977]|uniref:ABC transporter related protein n=2 Tax=Oceanithermus profundus TaxID=187137 RepID=E4U7C1_OCEP5|nr:ABC transporter related protein [Oceanithermus profundus DSM 14977]